MPRPSRTLRLDDPAPPFAARDAITGGTFALSDLLRDRRVLLLVFHRGMWSPNCRGQLGELRDVAPAYADRGIGIAAVLAQRCERIARAAERGEPPCPFPILCDPGRGIVKAYGVWHPLGIDSFNTAHPASFLIDSRTGRVRYAFVGSTQFARAPLSEILRRAESAP